jgi:hypothetical protein
MLYRERIREIAFRTEILEYNLSKSYKMMLMEVCGG